MLQQLSTYIRTLATARDARSLFKGALLKFEDELLVERGGFSRRFGVADRGIANFETSFVLNNHTVSMYYEIFGLKAYGRFPGFVPKENEVVLDLGANQGLYTLWALTRSPHCKVVAVEPDPQNLARLSRHLEINGIKGATVVPCCVGASCGAVRFWRGDSSGTGRVIPGSGGPDATETEDRTRQPLLVEMKTLDALASDLNLSRIDTIKMDIEGAEVDALKGGTETLKRAARVVMEYHSNRLGQDAAEILAASGFRELRHDCALLPHIKYFERS
jgi:FkbM family methyltransferase